MPTINEFFKNTVARLTPTFGSEGATAAVRMIFEDVAGYDRKFIFMNGDRSMTDFMVGRIDDAVKKVEDGEPVQYAVGKAQFMGRDFIVNPSVLIPRPETEGLVDMIVKTFGERRDLRVLDIGTGSGCIAVSLAAALPFSRVTAMDISSDALAVAAQNAKNAGVKIDFIERDILTADAGSERFDIIVSNPPYVCRSEAAEMDSRVLDYEPDKALFVSDDDPLVFYRAIAAYARKSLNAGGGLYFEINSRFPEEMRRMLEETGFTDVEIMRDFRGNYRFAIARQVK